MAPEIKDARILMYSHDTFGLGHLSRCRTIAHALVDQYPNLRVLIISGATIAGAFDYRPRVDFVKVPSVIKLRDGEYTSMSRRVDLQDTLKMRQSIIRHTAESFKPDLFIVDKEPMGLKGEVEETLAYLKAQGTTLVLGLRDVMDAPHLLAAEWKKNNALQKIEQFYDRVWVYGPPDFHDPLEGLDVSPGVRRKMDFVGFLQRSVARSSRSDHVPRKDYLLITTGGGGDGVDLVSDVVSAYEQDPSFRHPALIVLGPYMPAKERFDLVQRCASIPCLEVIEFDNKMESLIDGAKAVVAMGGYNTFCEILSFNKPALIVPRTQPREEQLIRASRASALGLVDMLHPEQSKNVNLLISALKKLILRAPPSETSEVLPLEGLVHISSIVGEWLKKRQDYPPLSIVSE